MIPDETQFWSLLDHVRQEAEKVDDTSILNWLRNKSGENSWVLECLSLATSKMNRQDWFTTSANTNVAEAAHALSQAHGTRLTLVSAVQIGRQIDARFAENESIAKTKGISKSY